MFITAVQGCTLYRILKLKIGSQTMTLTTHDRMIKDPALLDLGKKLIVMGCNVLFPIKHILGRLPFLKPMNYRLCVVADNTGNPELAYPFFVLSQQIFYQIKSSQVAWVLTTGTWNMYDIIHGSPQETG